jgi:ABC-type thiamin/hydroxymethylpyrimidine transport system permease subunit
MQRNEISSEMWMFNVIFILWGYYRNALKRYLRGMEYLYHALPCVLGINCAWKMAEAPAVYIIYIGMSVIVVDINATNVRIPPCVPK